MYLISLCPGQMNEERESTQRNWQQGSSNGQLFILVNEWLLPGTVDEILQPQALRQLTVS